MKKIIFITALFITFKANAQNIICIAPQCLATHVHAGDTAIIGAALTTTLGFGSVTFKQLSGPSTALITPIPLTSGNFNTGNIAQQNATVANLVQGLYLVQATGVDQKGNVMTGIDSILVAAAIPGCQVIPTITSIQTTIFGIPVTIPAGVGTKVGLSNGTTQSY